MYYNLLSETKENLEKNIVNWTSNFTRDQVNKTYSIDSQYTLDFHKCKFIDIQKKQITFKIESEHYYKKLLLLERIVEKIYKLQLNSIIHLSDDKDTNNSFYIHIKLSNVLNLKKIDDVIDKSKNYRILFNIDKLTVQENKTMDLLFKILEIEELVDNCDISSDESTEENYDIENIYPNYEDFIEMKKDLLHTIKTYENTLDSLKEKLNNKKYIDILTINSVTNELNNLFGKM